VVEDGVEVDYAQYGFEIGQKCLSQSLTLRQTCVVWGGGICVDLDIYLGVCV